MDVAISSLIVAIVAAIIGIPSALTAIHEIRKRKKAKELEENAKKVPQEDAIKFLDAYNLNLDDNNLSELLKSILSNNLYVSDKGYSRTGIMSNVGSSIFLDIFSASTNVKNREILAKLLCKKIQQIERDYKVHFDIISVPKMGNTLLGDAVARILNRPLVVVRNTKAIRFGYPFEGYPQTGQTTILVDDISCDGSFLKTCVDKLRHYGLKVFHCACLYNRSDGDAKKELEAKNVSLHYYHEFDDDNLKNYINQTDDNE